MPEAIPYVLALWPITAFVVLWRAGPRIALLFSVIAGWVFLPTASYPAAWGSEVFPHWLSGVALESTPFWNKASAIGLASALCGGVAFWRRHQALSFSVWDLLAIAWCLSPVPACVRNGLGAGAAVGQVLYLAIVWGAPYFAGRVVLASERDWRGVLIAITMASALIAPLCLAEWALGPFAYESLYGAHPYQYVGVERYVGFRPLAFFEDGNQAGIFLAAAAYAALSLWRETRFRHAVAGVASMVVFLVALLAQSVGAILLLPVAVAARVVAKTPAARPAVLAVALLFACACGLMATGVLSPRWVADNTAVGAHAKAMLKSVGRGSFGWRLGIAEKHLKTNWRRAIIGWGDAHWWENTPGAASTPTPENPAGDAKSDLMRPWSMWQLLWGAYGAVGVGLLAALIVGLPTAVLLGRNSPSPAVDGALILLMLSADAMLNSFLIVSLAMLLAGGLASSIRRTPTSPQDAARLG